MTKPTNNPEAALAAAAGRHRVTFDAPRPEPEPEVLEDPGPVAYADLPDDELAEALHDRDRRREALADPAVKVRLAKADPDLAPEIEAWEARAQAAEERAEAALAAAAGPRPARLPGGDYGPTPPAPPTGDEILRGALRAARGEHVDWAVRGYVSPGETTSASFTTPQ